MHGRLESQGSHSLGCGSLEILMTNVEVLTQAVQSISPRVQDIGKYLKRIGLRDVGHIIPRSSSSLVSFVFIVLNWPRHACPVHFYCFPNGTKSSTYPYSDHQFS